jgi:hypothetical protein
VALRKLRDAGFRLFTLTDNLPDAFVGKPGFNLPL